MRAGEDAVESAIREVTDARQRISRKKTPQVRSADEIDYLKTIAYTWFKSHQPALQGMPGVTLGDADQHYTTVLNATGKYSARSTYLTALKALREALVAIRTQVVTSSGASTVLSPDITPDFSALASDNVMKAILVRRWEECQLCAKAGAHLASTVMMGALLEALFVARANKMPDKSALFSAKSTPLDSKTRKPIPLQEWTLQPYIDVSCELGWITKSGKDVAAVLRDYRNYVHPEKERRHGIILSEHDSKMFWEVTKLLANQLLKSV